MRWPLVAASLSGFTAVAFGALGSHILKPRLAPEDYERFLSGLQYHQFHALALLALGLFALTAPDSLHKPIRRAALLFLVGMVLFCGTLYLHALTGISVPLAPWGGGLLMIGWITFACSCWQRK